MRPAQKLFVRVCLLSVLHPSLTTGIEFKPMTPSEITAARKGDANKIGYDTIFGYYVNGKIKCYGCLPPKGGLNASRAYLEVGDYFGLHSKPVKECTELDFSNKADRLLASYNCAPGLVSCVKYTYKSKWGDWVARGCSEKSAGGDCKVDDMGVMACRCEDKDYCNSATSLLPVGYQQWFKFSSLLTLSILSMNILKMWLLA